MAETIMTTDAIFRAMQEHEAEFWAIRGQSIQAYANVEQALCSVFAVVAGLKKDVAGIIFFKITNTQARNAIIERLIRKKFGTQYNPFWNSIFKELRIIDLKRNEIVHWGAVGHISPPNPATMSLMPPNFWDMNDDTPNMTVRDLKDFILKCDLYFHVINGFAFAFGHPTPLSLSLAENRTWLEIFQQPLIYPLPEGHVLAQKPQAPDNPPQSSPA